ncbi:ATP dependent DNA ligase domain-containing protein [Limtongia smithiae]|uniref:ATP dependent DNA ligase domain-containing protein n=1 Tax=Limtongia smithiae TaxID=1125753 RepID=UPI0034CD419B
MRSKDAMGLGVLKPALGTLVLGLGGLQQYTSHRVTIHRPVAVEFMSDEDKDENSGDQFEAKLRRPKNHGKSPYFHSLITGLINPLIRPSLHHQLNRRNTEQLRRDLIVNFITIWKKNVGFDIYPCFRLLLPYNDKERSMYGLKEASLARLLVKIIGLAPDSEDANQILNYKLPGVYGKGAGDFAERCYEVMSKREVSSEYGHMTIDEVNDLLDDLSHHSKSENQLPILSKFYNSMNATEMKWLLRIILRQLHIGLSERKLFSAWHIDANALYNVTSSLKRVCWELYDTTFRLSEEENKVTLMSCFQPQLAAFPKSSYSQVIKLMKDEPFWIEEKMDGERIQVHMSEYGKNFKFFSRRAKDYTYLYGDSLQNKNGALTKYLSGAFIDKIESCILDGEMVSWDSVEEKIEPFGYLKAAAISEKENDTHSLSHPLYRVFDILSVNGRLLVDVPLYQRREILTNVVRSVPFHFEIHPHEIASSKEEIERRLRQVVAESSEGLVIKNPTSGYFVNSRGDEWIKVKPEYMTEFGENLDCIVIGGYYGQGKRGGILASFLCGLRVDTVEGETERSKYWSFCRVGGGFTANDYATIRHLTDGHWQKWDPYHPPDQLIELAGDKHDKEIPDMWIKPEHSVVLEIKAAAVVPSPDQYRTNYTLRFPRFRKIRSDKDYKSALSFSEFLALKIQAEQESQERAMSLEGSRRAAKRVKQDIDILTSKKFIISVSKNDVSGAVFTGHTFCLLMAVKDKPALARLIAANDGKVISDVPTTFNEDPSNLHLIAEKDLVKVISLKRQKRLSIIKPEWIHDCIYNRRIVPYEPRHLYFATAAVTQVAERYVDNYGDGYVCEIEDQANLSQILQNMPLHKQPSLRKLDSIYDLIMQHEDSTSNIPSLLFHGTVVYIDAASSATNNLAEIFSNSSEYQVRITSNYLSFGGASITTDIEDPKLTHIVVNPDEKQLRSRLGILRERLAHWARAKFPRIVSVLWVEKCWAEMTRLSEEDFALL